VNLSKQQSDNYSEYFKKVNTNSDFEHLTPANNGSYTISFLSFKTMFNKLDENNFSEAFRTFEKLREEYSQKFGGINPNSNGFFENDSVQLTNFSEGYGPYSQDVLIPSFMAALAAETANGPLRAIVCAIFLTRVIN